MWGGSQDELPSVHDSPRKTTLLSNIDILSLDTGLWQNKPTIGGPHPGVMGCSCINMGENIFFFGGYCGHDYCYRGHLSRLNLHSLIWSNYNINSINRPMRKAYCGMLPLASEGLFIVGGEGPRPNNPQPNAEYYKVGGDRVITNEQHVYNLSTGKL